MNLRPKLPNTTQVHVNENKIKICLTTIIIEEKKITSIALPVTQCHCLSSCCCFIQKWCISNIQPCEVTDHCLKVQQGLQSSLSQFRLVWGIGCGPAGVKIYKTMTSKKTWVMEFKGCLYKIRSSPILPKNSHLNTKRKKCWLLVLMDCLMDFNENLCSGLQFKSVLVVDFNCWL